MKQERVQKVNDLAIFGDFSPEVNERLVEDVFDLLRQRSRIVQEYLVLEDFGTLLLQETAFVTAPAIDLDQLVVQVKEVISKVFDPLATLICTDGLQHFLVSSLTSASILRACAILEVTLAGCLAGCGSLLCLR